MRVLLDSGAYSLFKRKKVGRTVKDISLEDYADFIKQYSNYLDAAFNLDVIGDAEESFSNWLHLKKKGVDTIPVYHYSTDFKFFERYCDNSDYIGIGAIAKVTKKDRIHFLEKVFKYSEKKGVRLHGLGVGDLQIIKRYPWYSVDSSNLIFSIANGGILIPVFRNQHFDYLKIIRIGISSRRNHNIGSKYSFFSLSAKLKEHYTKLFNKMGFYVSDLDYEIGKSEIFNPIIDIDSSKEVNNEETNYVIKNDLTRHYLARFRFSLFVLYEYLKRLNIIYYLVITDFDRHYYGSFLDFLKQGKRRQNKMGVLISYFYARDITNLIDLLEVADEKKWQKS